MKLIPFAARSFVPAGHENPMAPGVLKKVLIEKADLRPGRVQMINWRISPWASDSPHTTTRTCRKFSSSSRERRR